MLLQRCNAATSVLLPHRASRSGIVPYHRADWRCSRGWPAAGSSLVYTRRKSGGQNERGVRHTALDEVHADNKVGQIQRASSLSISQVPTIQKLELDQFICNGNLPDLSKLFIAQSTFDEYVSRLVAIDQTVGRSGAGKEPGEFGSVGGCELRQSRSGGVCRERLGRGLGDDGWFGTSVKCGERAGCIVSYVLARYRLTLCKQCFFDIRGAALLEPANQPGSLVPSISCEEAVVVRISDSPYLAKGSCGEV